MAEELRTGVFVCECGRNIAATVDCQEVSRYATTLPGVVNSTVIRYTCADPGQQEVQKQIVELGLNRVVIACCSPSMHETTFRHCVSQVGMNPYLLDIANIREHCSWVHIHDWDGSTRKAKDLVKMSVARAANQEAQEELEVPVTKAALVIGGGIAGIQASLDLADAGHQVYLVEKEPSIGGTMAKLDKTFPTMDCSI